jgi:hypothetical protein
VASTVTYKLEADARGFVQGVDSSEKALSKLATGVAQTSTKLEDWSNKQQRAAQRMEAMHEAALKMNNSLGAVNDKAQLFSNNLRLAGSTLDDVAKVAGLNVQSLGAIGAAADVAAIGYQGLTTSAVAFNAASLGVVGAGLAIGAAIGTLINQFKLLRDATDIALFSFNKLAIAMMGEGGKQDTGWVAGQVDKIQESFGRSNEKTKAYIEDLHSMGMSVEDLKEKYAAARPEILKFIESLAKQDAGQKKASASAKQAGEAAAREAKQAAADLAAFQHSTMQEAQKLNKAFHEEWARIADATSKRIVESYLEQQKALEEIAAEQVRAQQSAQKGVAEMNRAIAEEMQRQHEQAREEVLALADAFFFLADALGGAGGGVAAAAGGFLQVLVAMDDAASKNISTMAKLTGAVGALGAAYSSASPLKGAIAGASAGAAFGPIGALVGGIGGAIAGLFGKKKKKKQEQQQLLKDAESQLKSLADEWDKLRRSFVDAGASGVGALFQNIADGAGASQERMDRLGRMGAAAFQLLRNEGLSVVEAMEQMGPTIDSAIAAAEKSGTKLTGPLAMLAEFRKKVTDNQPLVNAIDGLGQYISALRATGSLTQEAAGDVLAELAALQQQAISAGFTGDQALALMAPTLFQLAEAARTGTIALDEETQAMIDQAEAAGLFAGLEDPMAQLVEIQQQMLIVTAELAKAFGATLPASVQEYIDKLKQIPTSLPPPPGGGAVGAPAGIREGEPTGGGGKVGQEGFASGGLVTQTGPAMLHGSPSRPEMVLNPNQTQQWLRGGGGGMTINVDARGASDPRTIEAAAERGVRRALVHGTNAGLKTAVIQTQRRG